MTDIVERLKAKPPKGFVTTPLMIDAADEIERLREEIKKLKLELDKKDANADMQYLNGMKYGWNCGLYENNETYETVKKSILLQIRHWKQHWRKSDD